MRRQHLVFSEISENICLSFGCWCEFYRSVCWLHSWLTFNDENNNKVAKDDEGQINWMENHTCKPSRYSRADPEFILKTSRSYNWAEFGLKLKVCLHTAAGFTFSDLCACKSMLKVKSNSRNIPLLSDYTHINTESICSPDADMLVTFLMYHFWFY